MKAFFLSLFLLTFLHISNIFAQSFSQAMELYRGEEYQEAAELFLNSDDERSQLFAGKSYLSLSDYSTAIHHLQTASESSRNDIRNEALYSLSMAHFGLENYDISLQYLFNLANGDNSTGLRSDAQRFYNQVLNYLSVNDRYETLYRLNSSAIQYDLVNSSKPFLEEKAYRFMVNELVRLTGNTFTPLQIDGELLSGLYSQDEIDQYPSAPEGTVYNIGVILPTFEETQPEFTIPRNLYYGMVLAADNFNEENSNRKINLIFKNSYENADSTAAAFSELAWSKKVDAVIGPLFSEPATTMARLSEEYQIPMLAPLANSDSLNRDYNYTFQMNPTFEIQGKKMAQFAVRELNLTSLAIITEEGSLGRSSALAFRHEAERLGATITYYIEENFASTGYDFSEVSNFFTTNQALRDSLNIRPSQGIYAPFTGEASTTLIDLLMNNLEAMDSNMVVLGSEEWEYARLSNYQRRYFDIFYTQSFVETPESSSIENFAENYGERFESDPDHFSRIGYDTANFLFTSLGIAGNPDYLTTVMRNRPLYDGLSYDVLFDGKRINQHVFIKTLTESPNPDDDF